MPGSFRAFIAEERDGRVEGRVSELTFDRLPAGDVLIDVEYSSLNFKDALAADRAEQGREPAIRTCRASTRPALWPRAARPRGSPAIACSSPATTSARDVSAATHATRACPPTGWSASPMRSRPSMRWRSGTAGYTAALVPPRAPAQWHEAGQRTHRRHRRHGRGRLRRRRSARRRGLRGRGEHRQARTARLAAQRSGAASIVSREAVAVPHGQRPAAADAGPLCRGGRQRRRRDARLLAAHDADRRQRCPLRVWWAGRRSAGR